MNPMPPFSAWTFLSLLLVTACAGGTRAWYVWECTAEGWKEPALLVQGPPQASHYPDGKGAREWTPPTMLDDLVASVSKNETFDCLAPLSDQREATAHQAPIYPIVYGMIASRSDQADMIMRWTQCVLGALTAVLYFFFARRAFHCTCVATLAGLLAAFHPFWIVNTGELNDGVMASFAVALCVTLGARAGQTGDVLTALVFGLALAVAAQTRAALLPFAAFGLLWFLWECRRFSFGWLSGFLALFAFANGVAPWSLRNWQTYERPVPVATSTYLHLWIGNNPAATGSTMDEKTLRSTLSETRLKELLAETNQAKRYQSLAIDVLREAEEYPVETMARRIQAAMVFLVGDTWMRERHFGVLRAESDAIVAAPEWLSDHREKILHGTMLGMLFLGFLGWRWSHAWREYGHIGAIAVVLISLPYVLSHGEALSGPRLPLDGVLLCFSAYALACFFPGTATAPESAEKPIREV